MANTDRGVLYWDKKANKYKVAESVTLPMSTPVNGLDAVVVHGQHITVGAAPDDPVPFLELIDNKQLGESTTAPSNNAIKVYAKTVNGKIGIYASFQHGEKLIIEAP